MLFMVYHINHILPDDRQTHLNAGMANTGWDHTQQVLEETDPEEVHHLLARERNGTGIHGNPLDGGWQASGYCGSIPTIIQYQVLDPRHLQKKKTMLKGSMAEALPSTRGGSPTATRRRHQGTAKGRIPGLNNSDCRGLNHQVPHHSIYFIPASRTLTLWTEHIGIPSHLYALFLLKKKTVVLNLCICFTDCLFYAKHYPSFMKVF